MALLEIRNLTKVFRLGESIFGGGAKGEVRAVDDVSLDIEPGETLGLVGESGSGKSTLGRLVLRLIQPTSGSVLFEGRDLLAANHNEMRRLRRDMQIIFQDPFGSLDPRMRVEDVITEPLIIHERMSPSSRRARVTELLRSVGPQIVNLLAKLQQEFKLTYLFISHSMPLVRYLATRIAVMHHGRIVEAGYTQQITERPQHAYTRSLLRATPEIAV